LRKKWSNSIRGNSTGDGISASQPDGVIDYNKAHPEMGKELNPSVYGPRRRIYCGFKFSW
jgi:hypothetical protein